MKIEKQSQMLAGEMGKKEGGYMCGSDFCGLMPYCLEKGVIINFSAILFRRGAKIRVFVAKRERKKKFFFSFKV